MKKEFEICLVAVGLSMMLIGCGSKLEVPQESPTEVVDIIESKDEYKTEMLEKPYDAVIKGDTILMSNLETSEKISDLPKESIVTVIGNVTFGGAEVDFYYCQLDTETGTLEGFVDGKYIDFNSKVENGDDEEIIETTETEEESIEEVESNVEESSSIADSSNIVEDSQNKQENKEQASQQSSGVSENTQQSAQETQQTPQSQADTQQSVNSGKTESSVSSQPQDNTASSGLTAEEQALVDALWAEDGSIGTVTEHVPPANDGNYSFDDSNIIIH